MRKIRLWFEKNYSPTRMLYLRKNHEFITGVIGSDIELTLWQKIQILFCKGVSVVFIGKDVYLKKEVKHGD